MFLDLRTPREDRADASKTLLRLLIAAAEWADVPEPSLVTARYTLDTTTREREAIARSLVLVLARACHGIGGTLLVRMGEDGPVVEHILVTAGQAGSA